MRTLWLLAGLALAFALADVAAGWWTVPVVALVAGAWFARKRHIALTTAFGALFGWILVLVWDAGRGALMSFAAKLAASMSLPTIALLLLTLVFPMLLAWSAAAIGQTVRRFGVWPDF